MLFHHGAQKVDFNPHVTAGIRNFDAVLQVIWYHVSNIVQCDKNRVSL